MGTGDAAPMSTSRLATSSLTQRLRASQGFAAIASTEPEADRRSCDENLAERVQLGGLPTGGAWR